MLRFVDLLHSEVIEVMRISMRKISEILRQKHELKRTHRDIARSLNLSVGTVSNYLQQAKLAKISWPLPEGMTEDQLQERILPKSPGTRNRDQPDWKQIQQEHRKKGVTLQLLWREYREQCEGGLGYSQFCKYYRAFVKTAEPTMRQIHKAGEKTFVDYAGYTMEWIEPVTGEIHTAQVFVGVLGASQLIFAEATNTQSLPDWIGSHIRMWEYFGGVTDMVVPDNLKSGVSKAHRYDPDINANYQHVGEHYGFAIVPARVRKPKDKALGENAVGIVTKQILAPLRDVTFTSLADINAAIADGLNKLNNQRFQKLDTSRRELFESLEKSVLKPLPQSRYQYAQWEKAKVHIDYHFLFEKHHYSVPYQYIHKEVDVRATATTVECFYKNKRIATHPRSNKKHGYTTCKEFMPPAHRAQAEWSPERMRNWAKKIGIKTAEFIEVVMRSRPFPEQSYRACLGILRLGKRYGEDRLEKASVIALTQGMTRYKQIESILKNKMDQLSEVVADKQYQDTTTQQHQNIRGARYYH